MEFGKRLVELRGDRLQSEVAEAVGVSISSLSSYENGQRIPRDDVKIRLANYFGVTVQSIFFTNQEHSM